MTFGTKYTERSDEREDYSIAQKGVSVGESSKNQPDGDYCNTIPCIDYDYSDCADVDYVSVVVLTGVCKRRTRATNYSRFGHRGPCVHAARACRLLGIPGVIY